MDTLELRIPVADDRQAELLSAELSEYPFESFMQEEGVLCAYGCAPEATRCRPQVDDLLARFGIRDASYAMIADRDWNAAWESGFTPVEVEGRLLVRAPGHDPAPAGMMEVVVRPRLAFGTGHHVTTRLMASELLDMEVAGARGFDMGCGTGVLAIVAAKKGALRVDAVDIDAWACENCRENVGYNRVAERVVPRLGGAECLAGQRYDFGLANINRNVLVRDMPLYAASLAAGGLLAMSGFLEEDLPLVETAAHARGLTAVKRRTDQGWAVVVCRRAEK